MKHIEALIATIAAIFVPIQPLIITTAVLLVIDLISGVIAAKKRGEQITSAGFRRTVTKIFVYEISLMIGFVAETYMIPLLPISKMVSSMIALVEVKSIYENIDEIGGGGLLKTVIDKIGSQNQ